ncbi:hypothetical protein, partial [Microbacterium panaciterrae]|uniref:hypothetical protein n=1 Tax=Microbacterium panaciterrae TaxID=985759 RepID=UPI0031E7D5D2
MTTPKFRIDVPDDPVELGEALDWVSLFPQTKLQFCTSISLWFSLSSDVGEDMRAVHPFAVWVVTVAMSLVAMPVAAATPAVYSPAPQVLSAMKLAVVRSSASRQPVVIDALTTPTEQTTAMPDGTMRLEQSSVPVRVAREGSWIPVDTRLVRVGDWFSPMASAVPVRFSPGGTGAISETQTSSGEWVAESLPDGTLPTPNVVGDTATYPEVMPGVDLKLVATKTGMASIYVVKSEQAAKGNGLARLQVAMAGAELTRPDIGRVSAKAADGSSLIAAQPLWWDSSSGGTYKEPGEKAPPAPVTHTMTKDHLTMDIGASVAEAEKRSRDAVEYPIFVDPDWSSGTTGAWYTDAAYPDASYLTAGASDVLRVGAYAQYRSDMFFQFPLGALAGKQILNAVLNTTQLSVDACPAGPISSHFVSVFGPGYTWNQEQSWIQAGQMWWSGAMQSWVGPQDCSTPATAVGWTVTNAIQSQAGQPNVHLAFTGDNDMSRRHYSRDATLIVTYNSPPDTPTNPTITLPSRGCGTANSPAAVSATSVTVSVNQTDPDPGNVDDNVNLYQASDLTNRVQWQHPGLVAQGQRSVTFSGLTDGTTYAWNARGSDWLIDGVGSTALCYFTVDTTAPVVSKAASAVTIGTGIPVTIGAA